MRRDSDTTASDLNRPDGNGLAANYESHDIGEAHFIQWAQSHGFTVAEWGIDMRDDDGEDGIVYDDKMDLKVYDGAENLIGLIDVKTKTSPQWLGQFNERHYHNYEEHAEESGVPTFVVMYLVSGNEIKDTFVVDVAAADPYLSSEDGWVSQFPDGNNKCIIPHVDRHEIEYLSFRLHESTEGLNI